MDDQPMSEDYAKSNLRPDGRLSLYDYREHFSIGFQDGQLMPNGMKAQTTSRDRWWGRSTIWGKDKNYGPMMTRYWIGRLRLHIFYRGDQDPDCHDHPWDFWTFPLTPYVEEVAQPPTGVYPTTCDICDSPEGCRYCGLSGEINQHRMVRQIVPAWRWSFRPATHTHRVLGRALSLAYAAAHRMQARGVVITNDQAATPYTVVPGKIVTIVWRSENKRQWGFLKNRDGKWCWVAWREYIFGNGKSAPCE